MKFRIILGLFMIQCLWAKAAVCPEISPQAYFNIYCIAGKRLSAIVGSPSVPIGTLLARRRYRELLNWVR